MTPFKYDVGDIVFYTNSYWVEFGEREIVGLEMWDHGPRYYISPTDTPWFPVSEDSLSKIQ